MNDCRASSFTAAVSRVKNNGRICLSETGSGFDVVGFIEPKIVSSKPKPVPTAL